MGSVVNLPAQSSPFARMADGLANLMSRLGTSADRNTQSVYWVNQISQQQVEAAYRSSWLARKVHDLPAFEMTRAGRNWQAKKEQITLLEAYEKRLKIWPKIESALRTARLHGGAAIMLGVRQGLPDQPLNIERVGKEALRYAVVLSRFQLSAPLGFDDDPESDYFGQPQMWEMQTARGGRLRVHPSRILTFHGKPLPEGALTVSRLDQFWGDPLLISIKNAIDNAETSQAAVSTLLHELKQDIIKIPGLTERLATEGAEEILGKRIEALNRFRSMFNALLLDGGDDDGKGAEEYEQRQITFEKHPELLDTFLGIVAGAADIPVTRLLGQSPGGLQSTGKGEQDDFNRMISSLQESQLAPILQPFDEILIRSALGSRDEDIYSEFAPLDDPDEKEESENEKREAETVEIYSRTNLIPADALAKAAANRLIESGRWPGLDQAIEESAQELGALDDPNAAPDDPNADPQADPAAVDKMEQRGTVTRDQAVALLADAQPMPLYVSRKLRNVDELRNWAEGQGLTLHDDPHVTIAYSRIPVDWMEADEDWSNEPDGGHTVAAGGPRVMDLLGTDQNRALVLLFASSHLTYRHERIRRLAGASHDYPEYVPHVTIEYDVPNGTDISKIEPYRGKLEFGPEIFELAKDG